MRHITHAAQCGLSDVHAHRGTVQMLVASWTMVCHCTWYYTVRVRAVRVRTTVRFLIIQLDSRHFSQVTVVNDTRHSQQKVTVSVPSLSCKAESASSGEGVVCGFLNHQHHFFIEECGGCG